MKKLFTLSMFFLAFLSIFSMTVFAATIDNFHAKNQYSNDQYTDIKGDEWYSTSVKKAYELGLMKGDDGLFNPSGELTIAEAIAIAARAHNIYMGGDGVIPNTGSNWYDGVLNYAVANGIIEEKVFRTYTPESVTEYSMPEEIVFSGYTQRANRNQVAYIFSNILPKSEFKKLNYITDIPDVAYDPPFSKSAYFLYESGVLAGSGQEGLFNGYSFITRAEAAALIIRVINPKERITYAPDSYFFLGNRPITDPYINFKYFIDENILSNSVTLIDDKGTQDAKIMRYEEGGTEPVLDYGTINVFNMQNPYDNGNNNPSETVTKSEGLKVILNMALGEKEKNEIAQIPASNFKNEAWVIYAQKQGLIDTNSITKSNEATPVTLEETINWLMAALLKYAPETNFENYGKILNKHFQKYSKITNDNISFAFYNNFFNGSGINITSTFRPINEQININENMTKGNMDIILTNAVNYLNIINGKKSQMKTADLPKNAGSYPYILAGIENEAYDIPFSYWDSYEPGGPRRIYNTYKDLFKRFNLAITDAYTELVNIDYETISEDSFRNAKSWSLEGATGDTNGELKDNLDEYIDYVKKNKIKITGKVTPLIPIVYLDGSDLRVRTKIEYTIVSSDTDIDLIFGDRIENPGATKLLYAPTVYKSKKNTIYVDIAFRPGLGVDSSGNIEGLVYYLDTYYPLSKQISGKFTSKTVEL